MKSILFLPRGRLLLTAVLALALVVPVWAAEHPDDDRRAERRQEKEDHIFSLRGAPEMGNLSTLMDQAVRNRQGEDIGNVRDFVVDRDGRIKYAVLGHGGVLGVGEQWTAVDWEMLEVAPEKDHFILDVTREQVAEAPTFDQDNWPSEPQVSGREDWSAPGRRDETRRTTRNDDDRESPRADRWAGDEAGAKTVTVEEGETLSTVAERVYGRSDMWERIYEANRDRIPDPDHVPVGTRLVIPDEPRR
jgi:phage tail protein X